MKARFHILCSLFLWQTALSGALAQTPVIDPPPLVHQSAKTARVISVHNAGATVDFEPREKVVDGMFRQGLLELTHKATVKEAWLSLVSNQDIVGIKVYTAPGAMTGTRAAVAAAVVRTLLDAGLPNNHIVLWDRRLSDMRRAGFVALADRLGIESAGSEDAGYDEKTFYDSPILGTLIYGDHELAIKDKPGAGRKSFVTRLLTQRLTKIVNLSPLLIHDQAGVAGNLYSLAMGSVDNTQRFEVENRRLATAATEIYAMEAIGDKVVLNIVDALICQFQGEVSAQLHYSTPLNQIRLSTDPVALDVLSIKEIKRQREAAGMPAIPDTLDIYENASLLELGAYEERKIEVQKLP